MAILTNNSKQNFDTTFTANHDANGDGTGLNPQPLKVDDTGSLEVYINGGGIDGVKIGITPQTSNDENQIYITAGQQEQVNQTSPGEAYLIVGGVNNTDSAQGTKGNYTAFSTDKAGALDVGGININNIPDDIGSVSIVLNDDNTGELDTAIQSARYDLIQAGTLLSFKRMYGFSQTITSVSGNKLMLNVSCYYGN